MINPRHQEALATFAERLEESSRFHMGIGNVHQTVRELDQDLTDAGIDYAILGAMALNAHGFQRETTDVNVLINRHGLERFLESLVGRGYRQAFSSARTTFVNTRTGVRVEFLTAGAYPGDGKPKPVHFPEPAAVAVRIGDALFVDLPTLINLKLASGMTQPARLRDLADVQDLARVLKLDTDYAQQLDPYVRETYMTLVQQLQSPDPFNE